MQVNNTKIPATPILIGLFVLVLPLWAQPQTGSVLSRVQTVDDPDLGDLIRVAIDNRRQRFSPGVDEEAKIVQEVTESFARIKLLDEQVEQTARRIKGGATADVAQEMMLAKAELESKRTIELAKLRQVMGIIPAHAFGRRPVGELKTWLHLDVVGERVIAFETRQPFEGRDYSYTLAGVMPRNRALDLVSEQLKAANRLPLRIDIHRTVDGTAPGEQLETEIIQLVKKTGLQMQVEIHKDALQYERAGFEYVIENGEFGTGRMPYRGPIVQNGRVMAPRTLSGIMEPNGVGPQVEQRLLKPLSVPATFTIEYPQVSEALAKEVIQAIEESAKRLGLAEFVEVKRSLRPAKPEELYLGQWRAGGDSRITGLDLEIDDMGARVLFKNGSTSEGKWGLEDKGLVVNLSGPGRLEGNLDAQGRLVVTFADETVTLTKAK
jgi:hypothetical protein